MPPLFDLFGLSEEQRHYQKTNRCPAGHFVIPPNVLRITTPEGREISPLMPFPLIPRSAVAECPIGHERWAMFGSSDRLEIRDIVETGRAEEDWYAETRVFNNLLAPTIKR